MAADDVLQVQQNPGTDKYAYIAYLLRLRSSVPTLTLQLAVGIATFCQVSLK